MCIRDRDGNVAPMDRICDLAEKYDALVMVDESHSAGVVGLTGHGVSEQYLSLIHILLGIFLKPFLLYFKCSCLHICTAPIPYCVCGNRRYWSCLLYTSNQLFSQLLHLSQ